MNSPASEGADGFPFDVLACLVSDRMWPALTPDAEPEDGGRALLEPPVILAAASTLLNVSREEEDSGVQTGSSCSSSSSTCSHSSSESDWTEHSVVPSEKFGSLGLNPIFNIWSPTNEDDLIMSELPSLVRNPSESAGVFSSHDASDLTLPSWDSDLYEWGTYEAWFALPSPSEAEVLYHMQVKEEETIHKRAAVKRAIKKEKFFTKIFSRKRLIRSESCQ